MARRPEHSAPPEIFYGTDEAKKYLVSSRMIKIQQIMTRRAIDMLKLPHRAKDQLILDIGCGTALSGEVLEGMGHKWIGCDISEAMLRAAQERGASDCVIQHDMGTWLPFRPATFDGAISISAVQWLCNADRREHVPQKRLKAFFTSLFTCLRRGARAVLQFYPENAHQTDMITRAAMTAGFGGGLVVDYPHSTRARKSYLVLMTVTAVQQPMPEPLDGEEDDVKSNPDSTTSEEDSDDENGDETGSEDDGEPEENALDGSNPRKRAARLSERAKRGRDKRRTTTKSGRPISGTKEWVLLKKAQRREFGEETKPDSKYTARRRRPKF